MARYLKEQSLVIASHNQGKIREISALLAPFEILTHSAASLDLPVPEEDGQTYLENAIIKAQACAQATNLPSLGDDSGIEVEGLLGAPGVDTAPYTKRLGGLEKVFSLWQEHPEIARNPEATFVCFQVLAWPDGHVEYFRGLVKGRLVFPPRGTGGHGYDPIFIPAGYEKTVAQMTFFEKNLCSHRFLALRSLMNACLPSR